MCSNLYPTALFLTMRNQASAASEGWKDVLGHFKGQDQTSDVLPIFISTSWQPSN